MRLLPPSLALAAALLPAGCLAPPPEAPTRVPAPRRATVAPGRAPLPPVIRRPAPPRAAGDLPLEQVLASARAAGRPAVLCFCTQRCGWCDRLERETLSRPEVAARLASGFVFVRYDASRAPGLRLSQRFGMPGFPTLVVVDPDGRELGRVVGFRDADALLDELGGY